jgi:hypothetical protein
VLSARRVVLSAIPRSYISKFKALERRLSSRL